MRIKNVRQTKLDMGTIHVPVIIMDECPNCKSMNVFDYSCSKYMYNTYFNKPFRISLNCNHCNKDWDSPELMLRVSLQKIVD